MTIGRDSRHVKMSASLNPLIRDRNNTMASVKNIKKGRIQVLSAYFQNFLEQKLI
jgi:hypothetical protein